MNQNKPYVLASPGIGVPAPPQCVAGLNAIERLSEVCKGLHTTGLRAAQAADLINGSEPSNTPLEDSSPQITISSLCAALDQLTLHIAEQVERICRGVGC